MDTDELKKTLRSLGWSQRELARRLEVDHVTVNRWSTGRLLVPGYAAAYLRAMEGREPR